MLISLHTLIIALIIALLQGNIMLSNNNVKGIYIINMNNKDIKPMI